MQWNTDEYRETPNEYDYANPMYYQENIGNGAQAPHATEPEPSVQPLDTYPDYAHGPTVVNSYDPAFGPDYREYRGPSGLEGYTTDVGAEQREAAKRGKVEGGKKRKGLAGLGGLGVAIGTLLLKFKTLLLLLLNFK